jgi:hypothetical protein
MLSPVAVVVLILFGGCDKSPATEQDAVSAVPNVITADIQDGIEKHIEEQTLAGNGFFIIDYEGEPLKLKLVRVHTEYLARAAAAFCVYRYGYARRRCVRYRFLSHRRPG